MTSLTDSIKKALDKAILPILGNIWETAYDIGYGDGNDSINKQEHISKELKLITKTVLEITRGREIKIEMSLRDIARNRMISRNEELKEHITLIITHIKMSMDHLDMINGEIDHVLWIQSDEALNAIQCDFINLLKSLEKKEGEIE